MTRHQRLLIRLLILLLALPFGPAALAFASPAAYSPAQLDPVVLLASAEDVTAFQVQTGNYRVETVQGVAAPCQQLSLNGFETGGAAGAPGLPMRTVLLGIPADATPSLEIISQPTLLPERFSLCPAPAAVAEESDGEVVAYSEQPAAADSTLYAQNAHYPAQAARIVESGWLGRLRYVRVELSPFQYNPVSGELFFHAQMEVRVHHSGNTMQAASTSGADAFTRSVQGLLLNGDLAGTWASQPEMALDGASNSGWMPPLPALRLTVREEGLYAVSYDELAQAGVPVGSISSHNLRLYLNGQDVAVRVVDSKNIDDTDGLLQPGDQLLFYGNGVDEKYTDANIYWLAYGAPGSLHMLSRKDVTGGQAANSYRATTRYEENFNYVSSAPKIAGYSHWYGRLLTVAGVNAAKSWQISMTASFLASGSQTASIEAAMVSRTYGSHHVKFYVNGTYVGDGQWGGANYQTFSLSFDQTLLKTGNNTIQVEIVNDLNGQTVSVVYLDWVQLHYQRQSNAVGDRLIFDGPGGGQTWRFAVNGFSTGELEGYDVTNPRRAVYLPLAAGSSVEFGVTESVAGRYLVQRTNQRRRVAAIQKAETADLLDTGNQADYFIIAHKDFLSAIQPLAKYRAERGLKVAVIDVQHIYDTFNYGRMSAQAIRDFLGYAYANWQTSGSAYVLLVGDGTFDPRGYRSDSGPTFIPPYLEMVDHDLGETAADNRYVTIVGTDRMPDMHLGRLPAESPVDVTAMVNKILDYESASADSGWNRNVLFVSDDLKGGGGAFYNFSNAIADGSMNLDGRSVPLLPDAYQKTKLYLPFDCANGDSCREAIVAQLNQGTLILSYVGHSAKEYWAEENLFNMAALNQLNNPNYPIVLGMTCLEGYYHEAEKGRMSLAEASVRKPRAGAVASWSATGLGLASGHDYLERGFFVAVFHVGVREIGPASTFGKIFLYANSPANKYDDLLDTFLLLGDPAMKLRTLDSVAETRQFDLFLPAVER
ncbi:MAG: hypothetical protein KJZ86_19590 [Caldilineaceae bacterium]|nr:hypothetical protein [Caldilineaceae bacterium]